MTEIMQPRVATICAACWVLWWNPERHKACREQWQDGGVEHVCLCHCSARSRELVAADGRRRRAYRDEWRITPTGVS